jgi:hypothetical protein
MRQAVQQLGSVGLFLRLRWLMYGSALGKVIMARTTTTVVVATVVVGAVAGSAGELVNLAKDETVQVQVVGVVVGTTALVIHQDALLLLTLGEVQLLMTKSRGNRWLCAQLTRAGLGNERLSEQAAEAVGFSLLLHLLFENDIGWLYVAVRRLKSIGGMVIEAPADMLTPCTTATAAIAGVIRMEHIVENAIHQALLNLKNIENKNLGFGK